MNRHIKEYRIESDLLGEVEVPANALFGAQTQRAIDNFPGPAYYTLGNFPELVNALMIVKKSAAMTNMESGYIEHTTGEAIIESSEMILQQKRFEEFPIHILQGGGGTSANMNANEVLANLAEEILGGTRGQYKYVHPHDHVNLNQSTNDVYPTSCHLAILSKWQSVQSAFDFLERAFEELILEFGNQERLSRTCLQDAVPSTYGNFFGGYLEQVSRLKESLNKSILRLSNVNLGGTIIGHPDDVPAQYFDNIIKNLDREFFHCKIKRKNNLYDAAQNIDELCSVSGWLELTARSLIKFGKDLRLLASGPEMGFGEITLLRMQPGSSIMPGKINPVIPEFVIQLAFKVVGNNQMVQMAVDHGELDLNVWEGTVVCGILESMDMIETAITVLAEKCLSGLTVPENINTEHSKSLTGVLTQYSKLIGYSRICDIIKRADGKISLIKKMLKEEGISGEW